MVRDGAHPTGEPLFTVVIPTYQRASVIAAAVTSVLEQSLGDFELIVVDDGSTDETAALLAAVDDGRLSVLAVAHGGVSAARNAGIAVARGAYVAFLDSDDEADPEWLAGLASMLDTASPGLIRCAAMVIDEASGTMSVAMPGAGPARYPYGVCLPGTYAIARTILERAGGFDERLRFGENNELLVRVLAATSDAAPVRATERPLVRCYRRPSRAAEYGVAPAEASAFLLDVHRDVLAQDPVLLSDHLAIVGTGHLRAGRRLVAARYFVRSFVARPRRRGLGRLLLVVAPRRAIDHRAGVRRVTVVVACPGVGRIARGYETFAEELAAQLQGFDDLDVRLLQGGRTRQSWQRRIPLLPQDSRPAAGLARLAGTHSKYVEHISFGLACVPVLASLRADVVFVSEHALGTVLARARWLPGLSYAVVFNNGGFNRPPISSRFDLVQEVTPHALEVARSADGSSDRHVLLPLAVGSTPDPPIDRRAERRPQLGLPVEGPVVISVGRLDISLKRMQLVVEAVAGARDRPFLVLLGQRHDETPTLEKLAKARLGDKGFIMATVDPVVLARYYEAADVFVMAGALEGFGRVYVEALGFGLPCVVDDNPVTRFVCGPHGTFVDGGDALAIRSGIDAALGRAITDDDRRARWQWATERFGWEELRERYRDLVIVASRSRR